MPPLHLDYPFAGSRMLRDLLRQRGFDAGRLHIGSLMKKMGIETIYRRPNTSRPAPGHRIYPYLLRGLAITRPNQVWVMDISYIPMARGFVYLAAVVDWFSRRILSWRLSTPRDVSFCLEAVEKALTKHGRPEMFNTDQGSQFTSEAFTGQLKKHRIAISMDGKGSWRDNVFMERIWSRSSTKRSISALIKRCRRREPPCGGTSSFTTRSGPNCQGRSKRGSSAHLVKELEVFGGSDGLGFRQHL